MNFKFLNILDLSAILDRFWIRDKNIIKTNPIQCTSLLYAESISAINLISKDCKDIDLRKLECVGINKFFLIFLAHPNIDEDQKPIFDQIKVLRVLL